MGLKQVLYRQNKPGRQLALMAPRSVAVSSVVEEKDRPEDSGRSLGKADPYSRDLSIRHPWA
jgi:hypothetical protein